MAISRIRVQWGDTGVVGGGLSTFYDRNILGPDPAAILTFFTSIQNLLPDDVTIVVPSEGDVINEVTGALEGAWTGTGGGQVIGGSSSVFALGTGARVRWDTAGIVGGRHVRGTTFLVPLTASAFATDGNVLGTARTTIQNAATALISAAAGDMVVWSRPVPGRQGSSHVVTGSSVPIVPTALRSRRS